MSGADAIVEFFQFRIDANRGPCRLDEFVSSGRITKSIDGATHCAITGRVFHRNESKERCNLSVIGKQGGITDAGQQVKSDNGSDSWNAFQQHHGTGKLLIGPAELKDLVSDLFHMRSGKLDC